MLARTRLSDGEAAARLAQAFDADYWRGLNPKLAVGRRHRSGVLDRAAISARRRRELLRHFAEQGYFALEPLLPAAFVKRLGAAVDALTKADWPPVFVFVYDPCWQVARTPAVAGLIAGLLGPGYRQTPYVWTHRVRPRQGATGYAPHADFPREPHRLNLWFSVTDATLDNGCMYLIPRDPVVARAARSFTVAKRKTLARQDVTALLRGARAVPVDAGGTLVWDHDLIHWGSAYRSGPPRVSLSMDFIKADAAPERWETPLLDSGDTLPTLEQRLYAIGKGLLAFGAWEPRMQRFAGLAQSLVATCRGNGAAA